jgi:hypothetical protein
MSQNMPTWLHNDQLISEDLFILNQSSKIDKVYQKTFSEILIDNYELITMPMSETNELDLNILEDNLDSLINLLSCSTDNNYSLAQEFIIKYS